MWDEADEDEELPAKQVSCEEVGAQDDYAEDEHDGSSNKTPQIKAGFDIPFPKMESQHISTTAESSENKSVWDPRKDDRPGLVHCKKRVIIPFVLPMESRAATQSQTGMGAFGRARDPKININQGSLRLPEDKLRDSVLSAFAQQNRFASQRGTSGFGAYRQNVILSTGGKDLDPLMLKLTECIIPKQAGTNKLPSMAGQTPIGATRNQVQRIRYKFDMAGGKPDPKTATFVGRLHAANPDSKNGTTDQDIFRSQTQEARFKPPKKDRRSEGILPKLYDPRLSPGSDVSGTGAGSYGLRPGRQVTTKVTGGYTMTHDEMMSSKREIPWTSMAQLQSQAGTGGFNKIRDVVNHAVVKF